MAKIGNKLDRIGWSILALAVIGGAVLGAAHGARWGAGGLTGGVVGYLNFRWLRAAVERMLGGGERPAKVRSAVAYAFKFSVLAGVLAGLVFWIGLPALAVLIGVGAMPMGIVAESVWTSVWPIPEAGEEDR